MNKLIKKAALMLPPLQRLYMDREHLREENFKLINNCVGYSCPFIMGCALNFNGRIDTGEQIISMCCEPIPDIPRIAFSDTPEETLERFLGLHSLVVREGLSEQGIFSTGCRKCTEYQRRNWGNRDGLIHYVNLSMYPAPCQSQCIYCEFKANGHCDAGVISDPVQDGYEKLFATLELAKKLGLIAADARWQISSGEITIHPFRNRILKLASDGRTTFFTNCFKYDNEIASILHRNPQSAINFSIDAGTVETWRRVKGIDNFDAVLSNLEAYHNRCLRPDQITLKYIVLPGVNDSPEDYAGLLEIMRCMKIGHLLISRDMREKYGEDQKGTGKLEAALAQLLVMCKTNNVTYSLLSLGIDREVELLAARMIHRKKPAILGVE